MFKMFKGIQGWFSQCLKEKADPTIIMSICDRDTCDEKLLLTTQKKNNNQIWETWTSRKT